MKKLYGKTMEKQITSRFLKTDIPILLYLPPNYSDLYSYDVLIAQDGKDYFELGRIARQTEELIEQNKIKDIIIAGIPYPSVEKRREWYHPNGTFHKQYLRFLAEELVPFLDKEFQTQPVNTGRVLVGDSLGATVSLIAALEYPHTFTNAILQSPFVNEDVLHTVTNKIQTQLQLYHVIGLQETEVQTTNGRTVDFLQPNRKLNQLLSNRISHYYYEEFNGDHTWKYWQPDLKKALVHMFAPSVKTK